MLNLESPPRSLDEAPCSLGRRNFTLGLIPDGTGGIRATLKHMARMALDARKDPDFIQSARALVAHLPDRAWHKEAKTLFEFVRDQIRYVFDPLDIEMVCTPKATLSIGQGDCDDKSTLLAALLMAVGHPVRFIAVGYVEPNVFEHVYVETKIGDEWIACETTEQLPFGQTVPGHVAYWPWTVL